jgi:hypothetical protein
MTAANAIVPSRSGRAERRHAPSVARLFRLELRRSTMLVLLPLLAVLLGATELRNDLSHPPLWAVRSMDLQIQVELTGAIVAAVAAWVATRERRQHLTDLVVTTVRPRWIRQLAAWAALTSWALVFYAACVAVVYGVTAAQAQWGGPVWWLPAVGAAAIVAFSAVGFAIGTALPSRFTAPMVAICALFAPQIGVIAIQHHHPWGRISPAEGATVPGTGTLFPFHPGLSIAQLLFLLGVGGAALGLLALPRGAGGRWLRSAGAAVSVVGALAAGTGLALADTARESSQGIIIIPALHTNAADHLIAYTPVCDHSVIPLCIHPAYQTALPAMSAQLDPLTSQWAGLPGAPVRIEIGSPSSQHGTDLRVLVVGSNALLEPGLSLTASPADLRQDVAIMAIQILIAPNAREFSPAQQAVAGGLVEAANVNVPDRKPNGLLPVSGSPADAAAHRFAALPASTRRAWLSSHLVALRAGRIALAEIP